MLVLAKVGASLYPIHVVGFPTIIVILEPKLAPATPRLSALQEAAPTTALVPVDMASVALVRTLSTDVMTYK